MGAPRPRRSHRPSRGVGHDGRANLARSQMRRWRSERRARDRIGPLHDDLSDVPAASGDAYAVREALRDSPVANAR